MRFCVGLGRLGAAVSCSNIDNFTRFNLVNFNYTLNLAGLSTFQVVETLIDSRLRVLEELPMNNQI